jgi:Clp amino terminal domain, pathogenicity island component
LGWSSDQRGRKEDHIFAHFSASARSSVTRAAQLASSEGGTFIEPKHILIALIERQPTLFEKASEHPIDVQAIQAELAQSETNLPTSSQGDKLQFSEECRQLLMRATEQARSCWKEWEAPRRKGHHVLPEDLEYWEARMKQPLRKPRFSGRFASWLLRRTWEVDEHHLFLGLLEGPESPLLTALKRQGVTLERARQRLCATGG